MLFIIRYQPIHKLTLEARFIAASLGEDTRNENWGNNVLLPHTTRVQDYENEIGQGVGADIAIVGLDVSYQLWHNIFLDFNYFYRQKNSENPTLSNRMNFFGGGLRMNIGRQRFDF